MQGMKGHTKVDAQISFNGRVCKVANAFHRAWKCCIGRSFCTFVRSIFWVNIWTESLKCIHHTPYRPVHTSLGVSVVVIWWMAPPYHHRRRDPTVPMLPFHHPFLKPNLQKGTLQDDHYAKVVLVEIHISLWILFKLLVCWRWRRL